MQSNPGSSLSPNPSSDPNDPQNLIPSSAPASPETVQSQPALDPQTQVSGQGEPLQFDPNNPATYSGYYQQPDYYDPNNPTYSGMIDPNAQYYGANGYDQSAVYYPYNYNYPGTDSTPLPNNPQPQIMGQDYPSFVSGSQVDNPDQIHTAEPASQPQPLDQSESFFTPSSSDTFSYPDQNQVIDQSQTQQQNPELNPLDPGYSSVTYPQSNFMDYKSTTNYTSPFENNLDPYYTNGFNEAQPATGYTPADPANFEYNMSSSPQEVNVQATPVASNLQETGLPATIVPSGSSRRFYIITGIVIALLILVLGVTAFLTNQSMQNNNSNVAVTTSSTSVSQEESSSSITVSSSRSVGINFTDPNGPTPADLAKKNEDTTIPVQWLRQYFAKDLDETGKCQNTAVCADNADPSGSGMTNLEKYNYQIDPTKADTDEDGISDGDEVKVYFTDPGKKNSLNNGGNDFDKLRSCLDPSLTSNSINSTISAERKKKITENVSKFKLHEPTLSNLRKAGATDSDLQKGYIESSCGSVNIDI